MKPRRLVLALICLSLAGHATTQQTVDVTYIANEGFMVERGDRKFLLDAFFGGLQGNWADQPDEATAQQLVQAQPPFDDVDLVTISHRHADHFDAQMVIDHALNNRNVRILCPKQVETALAKNTDYPKIQDRVYAITPDKLHEEHIEIAGIGVRVLRLEHSHYMEKDPDTGNERNRHADVENLGFVLDVDGYKIFHCGDTNPFNETEYATFALQKEKIDLAFLERMFLAGKDQPALNVIEELIRPQRIVLMHIGPARRDAFRNLALSLDDRLPPTLVLDPMDRKTFPAR